MSGLSDHADAFLALLDAGALAGKVLDGQVPKAQEPPYVLVYFHGANPKGAPGTSLDGLSVQLDLRAICHCVGADATAARAMASAVAANLLDVVAVITGRECAPIVQESTSTPVSDNETGVQVMDQVDVYRLTTTPAA